MGVETGVVQEVPAGLDQQGPGRPVRSGAVSDPPGSVIDDVPAGRFGEARPGRHRLARVLAADQAVLREGAAPAQQSAERVADACQRFQLRVQCVPGVDCGGLGRRVRRVEGARRVDVRGGRQVLRVLATAPRISRDGILEQRDLGREERAELGGQAASAVRGSWAVLRGDRRPERFRETPQP